MPNPPSAGEMEETFKRPMDKEVTVKGEDYTHLVRRRGDRVHHLLHQHVEPICDDRRGPCRPQGRALGLDRKPWVKTSLAPGSRWSATISRPPGCRKISTPIGFNLVGYGCTTCIGNSGPIQKEMSEAINAEGDLVATSVLSGNRNFEGRISPDVRANYLASPPLVVAYALAGDMNIDLTPRTRLRRTPDGKDVYLKDIWPSASEIAESGRENRDPRGVPVKICRCL